MNTLDFSAARFSHLNWKFQLQAFIGGKQDISEKIFTDHHECDLGKWLYAYGLEKYKMIPEMKDLEILHKDLHETIKDVIWLSKTQGVIAANKMIQERITPMTDDIIKILNLIEAKVATL